MIVVFDPLALIFLGVGVLKNKLVNLKKKLELDGDFKPDFLSTCEVHMKTKLGLYIQNSMTFKLVKIQY